MPRHRDKPRLPKRLVEKVQEAPFSAATETKSLHLPGGGAAGARYGFLVRPPLPDGTKPQPGTPMDVRYVLKDDVITRTEFVRLSDKPFLRCVPVHISDYDSFTGELLGIHIDRFRL